MCMRIHSPKQSQVNSSFVMSLLIYPHRPTPIIYWIKEDGTLPVNRTFYQNFKKTLQITQVSEADSGNYQCIAKNTLGAVHHTISVTVKGITPPLPLWRLGNFILIHLWSCSSVMRSFNLYPRSWIFSHFYCNCIQARLKNLQALQILSQNYN